MSRKQELTYVKSTKQWCKTINGKRRYFGKGKSKSNKEDYQQALQKYKDYIAELDLNPEAINKTHTELLDEKRTLAGKKSPAKRNKPHQLQNCIRRYVDSKTTQVTSLDGKVSTSGGITLGRINQIKNSLSHFTKFYGARKQLSNIRPIDLTNYRAEQVGLMHEGVITQNTVHQRFSVLKGFLTYCWEEHILNELPRNIRTQLRMGIVRKAPDIDDIFNWKKGEVQDLYSACARYSKEMELYFLLATNCGFLVKEMSDLEMKHCLWKKRGWTKVNRPRMKTGVESEHTLWTRTEELWKELAVGRYGTSDKCFLRESGEPLCTYKNGYKQEIIGTKMKDLIRKTFGEGDKRSIRSLRKTGASFLNDRLPGSGLDTLYLAHKPKTMAAQHYSMQNYKELHRHLSYMEKDFGISLSLTIRVGQKPARRSKKQ